METVSDDYYFTASFNTTPCVTSETSYVSIPATLFAESTQYYSYTVTGLGSTDTVSVKAVDDGAYQSTDTAGKYWLEYDSTENRTYLFTIKDADSTKVMYKKVTVSAPSADTFAAELTDATTVKGFVGLSDTGKINVKYDGLDHDFDFSSGRYSILLPVGKEITLKPTIENKSADETYVYTQAAKVIGATVLSKGNAYTLNFAVTSEKTAGTNDITATMTIDSMTEGSLPTVDFTVTFTNNDPTGEKTYVLSGGSAWNNVTFYDALDNVITTISFNDTVTVHGKGTITKGSVAFAAEGMTVSLTDMNGSTVCTAKVTGNDEKWTNRTTASAETTKISIDTNTMGDSEYKYTLKIVNNDNFTKSFLLETSGVDLEKWAVTYVCGSDIYGTTEGKGTVYVKGYTTATIYVKITYITNEENPPDLPSGITVKATVTGANGISTDTPKEGDSGVTIDSETVVTATCKTGTTEDAFLSVDGNGASGRDVLDNKSDMPTYLWAAIAIIVAMTFLIIWMASKRGVFTRKK